MTSSENVTVNVSTENLDVNFDVWDLKPDIQIVIDSLL